MPTCPKCGHFTLDYLPSLCVIDKEILVHICSNRMCYTKDGYRTRFVVCIITDEVVWPNNTGLPRGFIPSSG